MSRENVELVLRFYEAWNGSHRETATLPFIGEEFEWINPEYAVETSTRRGVAGWLQVLESLRAVFEDFEHQPGECLDLGERVLCFAKFVAKGGASEIALERDEPHLWTMREGKILSVQWFHSRDEALKAAGLRESGG